MVKPKLTDYAFIGFVICFAGWRALFPLRVFDDPWLWGPRSLFFLGALATWPGGASRFWKDVLRGNDLNSWRLKFGWLMILVMALLLVWVHFFGVF